MTRSPLRNTGPAGWTLLGTYPPAPAWPAQAALSSSESCGYSHAMSTHPKDAPLWDAVSRATRDVLQMVSLLPLETERRDLTEYQNVRDLFSSDRRSGRRRRLRYADIATLADLIAAIDERPTVRNKFAASINVRSDKQYTIPKYAAAMIPLVLSEECLASNAGAEISDDEMLEAYAPYEEYLLGASGKDLRATITVPILGANAVQTHDSEARISIIDLHDGWLDLGHPPRAETADLDLIGESRSALRIRNAPVDVFGFGDYFSVGLSAETDDDTSRFFEALNIHSPGRTTWVIYVMEPEGWAGNLASRTSAVVALRRDYASRLDRITFFSPYRPSRLDEASTADVLTFQELLRHCNGSIRVAAKRLVRSGLRTDDDDRIIDLCIGLEALLGSGFSETVHRMSMRSAALLSQLWSGSGSSSELYRATRDLYAVRSKIVHGNHKPYDEPLLQVGETRVHASRFATAALAALLKRVVPDASFAPEKVDEMFVFSALDIAAELAHEDVGT